MNVERLEKAISLSNATVLYRPFRVEIVQKRCARQGKPLQISGQRALEEWAQHLQWLIATELDLRGIKAAIYRTLTLLAQCDYIGSEVLPNPPDEDITWWRLTGNPSTGWGDGLFLTFKGGIIEADGHVDNMTLKPMPASKLEFSQDKRNRVQIGLIRLADSICKQLDLECKQNQDRAFFDLVVSARNVLKQ